MKMKAAGWIVSDANHNYELGFNITVLLFIVSFCRLCSSYPKLLIVPKYYTADRLKKIAKFRKSGRLPAVVWRYTALLIDYEYLIIICHAETRIVAVC